MCYLLLFYYNEEVTGLCQSKKIYSCIFWTTSQTKLSNNSLWELIEPSIYLRIAEAEEDNPSTLYIIFVYFDASVNEALRVVYTKWQCTCYDDNVMTLAVHIQKAISGRSKGGHEGPVLPGGSNSFNFMQFLGKIDKIVC